MRSPNKDFPMDVEDPAPSKDVDFWEYSGDNFDTIEPNSSSLFPMSECLSSEMEENVGSSKDKTDNENAVSEKVPKFPCRKQTARKSLCRGNVNASSSPDEANDLKLELLADDDAANISAKVLHFFCQKCNNGIRYSPNDLQKHFQIMHNGELPLYPCEMCNFSANDFQVFKQHRKTHRSALVKCEICNNDYMYTLLGLTKHFSTMHCVNGRFSCSKCRFSTIDVGTFVQHIHRHNGIEYACQKCNHISFSRIEFQKHLQGHATLFPFSCQYCNYSAMRKDFIVKHVLARHREHVQTKDEYVEEACNSQMAKSAAGLKRLFKKYQMESPNKSLWRRDSQNMELEKVTEDAQGSSGFQYKPNEDSQALKEFTPYNYEQANKDDISSVTTIKCNSEDGSLLQNAVHGPTVLMVKNNKITVPANYCATFMGYKMVNGKQNLVIKLLPSNKHSANSLKTQSPSNSTTRLSQSPGRSFGVSSNGLDSRSAPSFKYSTQRSPSASVERLAGSVQSMNQPAAPNPYMARRNQSPVSVKSGSAGSQAFFENLRKELRSHSIQNSSYGSDLSRRIKEEPDELSINEQHNYMPSVNDQKSYECSGSRINASSSSSYLNVNSKADNLYRHRHSSESSGLTAARGAFYPKDSELRSSTLSTSMASSLGRFASTNSNVQSKNDFVMRNAGMNERQGRAMENSRCNNFAAMPRITSVFSLQNRPSDTPSTSSSNNTYLHNMLQDNKRINDKVYLAKTPSPLLANNSFPSPKPSPSNQTLKFDPRVSNGDSVLKTSVANSPFLLKQEQESSGLKSYSLTVSELLKSHSDAIVSQQLAKEKIGGMIRAPTGTSGLQLIRSPQPSSVSHSSNVLYPPTNRFILPVIPTTQPGFKMVHNLLNTPNSLAMSAPTRANAPVTLNTKPSMVLTFTNGPFGAIRNVSSGASQGVSTVNNQARFPFTRLQRPSVPQTLKMDFRDVGKPQNVSNNAHPVVSPAKNLPINLNVLQYCINSGSTTGNLGSSAKHQEPLQKQPLYAILPDGKQAVLLNYVLPKNPTPVQQRPAQGDCFVPKILPKKSEDTQQTVFLNKNVVIPATSIKKEDTSCDGAYAGSKDASSSLYQAATVERKPNLRSTSSLASSEHLNSTEKAATPSTANAKVPSLRCRQNIPNTWNTRNKPVKRKVSVDSTVSRVEPEVKDRAVKRKPENVPEPPRKKMLHRKCKEKNYSSEADNVVEVAAPKQIKDIVRTLKLYPVSADQPVHCPNPNQPVVVLNHPDADIPEVINLMSTISKFSGQILSVTLSKRTIEALLESRLRTGEMLSDGLTGRRHRRSKPISPVKERFVLKLTLKKTSKNNYKIVKNTPGSKLKSKFSCWFCGRIFDNQDAWVGHGQRHLMEATKDWNTLF
uniref:Zinc finger protein 518A n=1 Tax=Leptobrachium leishanense TaxID=445787 RepID=A0A8C5PH05_9ANUR